MSEARSVALLSVVARPQLWPRRRVDQARVAEFVGLYRDGGLDALPPLDVVPDGQRLLLADGWHRLTALQTVRSRTAQVRLLPADPDPLTATYRHALLTASSAALPLTRAERRAAVRRLLTDSPQLSDRQIARLAGVSPTTVGTHRRQLTGPAGGDNIDEKAGETGEQLTDRYLAAVTADRVAQRLAGSLDKLWAARPLTDTLLGDRTGKRLAQVLVDRHGDQALPWARRVASWAQTCLTEVEATGQRPGRR